MSNYRKILLDRVTRLYGFEDEKVVAFANLCEKYVNSKEWDNVLWMLATSHEQFPVTNEE